MADPWADFADAADDDTDDPWSAFADAPKPSRRRRRGRNRGAKPAGAPVDDSIVAPLDGDTLRLESGGALRLWGVDAPELNQPGWTRDGSTVPIGQQSRNALAGLVDDNPVIGSPAGQSYGRTVAPITIDGGDVGQQLARHGNALAAPEYLAADPQRRFEYMQAERLARVNSLGVHDTMHQPPADYRKAPLPEPTRETVAQFWDTPTPKAGMRVEVERQAIAMMNDAAVPVADIVKLARDNGFVVDPADIERSRAAAKRDGKAFGIGGYEFPEVLTDQGDGATGAVVRGAGSGFLAGGLDEVGAFVDTAGMTSGRENVWNSDRRLADIWFNNQEQNASILGYDEFAHPTAHTLGEVGGAITSGFVIPYGQGARTVPQLARAGGVYGGAEGFLGTDGSAGERAIGGAIGVPIGAAVNAVGGKALEAAAPYVAAGWRRMTGNRLPGALAPSVGVPEGSPPLPPAEVEGAGAAGQGQNALGHEVAMAADGGPSITQELPRQRDYLFPPQATRMDQPLTEAQMRAAAERIEPGDVLPVPSNVVESADEAAATQAGRIVEAKAPNERGELSRGMVRNWRGEPVPKVGPVDLVGWLRTRGGLADQAGELSHMGLDNRARTGLDFVGQEARFGPLVNNESGMFLNDAAFASWEAGYFPELTERPDVNTFLDALRDTWEGRQRRFLPEDQPEIERFYAAQAERFDLEQQRFETGQPIYRDNSVPADDPAPLPPVTAYEEWPADGPDFAGNINLGKLESPQDIKRALSTVEKRVGFDAATRGRVTHAETERLATELGMTPETLLARRKGQALNAEEALAARQLLAKSGNELVNAAKRIKGLEDPGAELLADFRHKWMRHVAIQEQVAGAIAEAGRALQQFRMAADSRAVRDQVLNGLVRGGGGQHNLQEAAEALIDAVETSPGVFNAVAKKATKPKWSRRIGEVYINFLLSNPATHVVNTVSNTLTAMAQIPEHATAAMFGKARQAFNRNATDRVIASEVGARVYGLVQGAREGARLFARAIKTGEASDYVSKVEGDDYKAIPGVVGEVLRVPTRLLTAEDELFKGIARRMELNGLAVRQAHNEGLKGEAARKRIAELSADPSDELLEQATEYGRYLTFQNRLGPFAQNISNAAQHNLIAKLYLPFIRTPTNLMKFAAERSPAAPMLKRWRKDFAAGGARRDLAVARMMVGTGFGVAIYQGALNGYVTGAMPSDPKKARLLSAEGWQPYSIKLGDTYYSYKRLDPFAMTLGVAADLATLPEGMSERQRENEGALLVASIMGNLASKTWLSGVSDLVEALSDPARNTQNMLERLVGSLLVPAGMAGVARALDPTARQTESIGEALKSRTPGLRDDLLPRRDIWGEEVTYDSGFLSPAYTSTAKRDPVNIELLKTDYAPGYVPSKVGGRELTAAEQDAYQEQSGKLAHERLTELVAGTEWRAMDVEERARAAKRIVDKARDEVRGSLFSGGKPASGDPWGQFNDAPGQRAAPAKDDPWSAFKDPPQRDVLGSLARIPGLTPGMMTSGYRTPEYQAEMRRRGYKPADNSGHLDGSSLDIVVPPGKSMRWLQAQVKRVEPDAVLLPEGDHLHATFPGWYGAPVLGGAVAAGLVNPMAR